MDEPRKPSRAELGERAFVGLGGRSARVLAHGPHESDRRLCIDDRYVYWTEPALGEVSRIPKSGGIPMVLAQGDRPTIITHIDGYLYWSQHDPAPSDPRERHRGSRTQRVVRMLADGGPVELVTAELDHPECIAVQGDDVAIGCMGRYTGFERRDEGLGAVVRAKLGDTRHRVVATRQRWPISMAFVDDDLYWLNWGWKVPNYFADGAVMRIKRDGETFPTVVQSQQKMAHSLLVDEAHLYWCTSSSYEGGTLGGIFKRSRGGGDPIRISTHGHGEGTLLAQDATHIYAIDRAFGAMYRVAKGGGEPEPMMRCEDSIVIIGGIAVDDQRVYWSVHNGPGTGGALWSMSKEPVGVRADEPPPPTPFD